MNTRRKDILAQVAVWYYEDGMKQDEIGKLIGKSRSMISRMLNEVRELGLIEVKVKYSLKRNLLMEEQIKMKFGLKDVRIVNTVNILNQDMIRKMVSKLSGGCVVDYLTPGIRIGIGWSRTIYSTLRYIPEIKISDSEVVQLSGSISLDVPDFDGVDMTRELARKLDASYYYFPAPMVVSNPEIKERLMKEKAIKTAMEKASDVDLALVGIGSVVSQNSALVAGGLIDSVTLKDLEGKEPAGDILATQISINGERLDISLNQRVIGLNLEELEKIKSVIAVSTGPEKIKPILSVLRGGWINILVSDDKTMADVLELVD